jgi:hypothetical protein
MQCRVNINCHLSSAKNTAYRPRIHYHVLIEKPSGYIEREREKKKKKKKKKEIKDNSTPLHV